MSTLDELKEKGCVVVTFDRPVAVFYHDGKVYGVDNRCPHMGFPLHRGTVNDGILTCYWHHARFDLASGCTFDLFADDVASYPIEIRHGEVWVLPRRPLDEAAHWKRRLQEGMEQNISLVMAKGVIALLNQGVDAHDLVRQASLFGSRYRDNWQDGLTVMTAMANLLPYLTRDEKVLPLWHGVVRIADNVAGQSPRWDRQPLAREEISFEQLKRWLRRWTLVRQRDGAERCVLTAISSCSPHEVAEALFAAATDRIFADGGHLFDFVNKAFELLEITGWDHASHMLPTVVRQLVGARGGEESSAWRQPVDLVPIVREAEKEIPTLLEQGRNKGPEKLDVTRLLNDLLSDSPERILSALKEALSRGVGLVDLSKAVAYAAAMRICRFGVSNEFPDWVTVLHTFSYCNAVHQALKRLSGLEKAYPTATRLGPSPEVVRAVFHGALAVYLDRFLNIPPAPLLTERKLDDLPSDPNKLLAKFLETLDRKGQVDEAGRIVARYLSLRHAVEPLIRNLTYAVVREDSEFHTYQMLEAAVRQYKEWHGTEEGNHILIAAARYVAAHSPTLRQMYQTADIALRLHRGEALYEQSE